ncbi:hypothetical protein CDAR_524411 [Caerostris darwini]|uniref:Uncharacterized protein n=1 Tax=Caerostris darwini TaxID=1538125 RepID=A0AAV4VZ18_9ARAC|nr:hypothetical protein CDAR_524411 [Caerostris darwini]
MITTVGDPIPDYLRLHQPVSDVLGAAVPSAEVMSVPRPVIDTFEDTHSRTSRRGRLMRSPQRLNLSNTVRFESSSGHSKGGMGGACWKKELKLDDFCSENL